MNHENAWKYTLDMLDDSPLGQAAAQCKAIGYNDEGWNNRTFTILAPNRRVAFMVDTPAVITHLKSFLHIIGDMVLKLNIQVDETDDDQSPEYPFFGGWAQVLETLQAESPRASYDTWIRETWPVSLSDGILTVGARNAYAAEWLTDRVAARAGKLASALLGKNVTVNFIVGNALVNVNESDELEDPDENARDSSQPEIIPAYDTAYDQEVKPDQRIALPGYALRLLRHGDLSLKEMTLWVAFRQSTYYRWSKGQTAVKNIPHWDVLRYANMSRSSLEREIAKAENGQLCGGLVSILPEDASAFTNNPHYDCARRYQVQVNPRLTRRDCNAIHILLYRAVSMTTSIPEALEVAEKTLKDLLDLQPTSYLDAPENQQHPVNDWPRGVIEIVRLVTGHKGDLPDSVHQAAEQLQEHILSRFGLAMISLYFLHTVAPRLNLTHAELWAVIVLRYRCAYDPTENENLGYALFHGGMDELAERCGTSVKSLKRWMEKPSFGLFARIENVASQDIPEHWTTRSLLFDVCPTEPIGTKCDTVLDKMTHNPGQNDTPPRTKCDTGLDKMTHDSGQNDTQLKRFIKFQPISNKIQESPQTPRLSAQKPGKVGSRAYWDWDFLMARNAVSTPMSKKLLIANKKAGRDISSLCQKFVSWILYGYSDAGRGLANPVSNALARLKENTFTGAGGDFDRLAALPPNTLRAYINLDLAGHDLPDNHQADAYTFNFANLPKAAKRDLRGRLFE